MHDTVRLVWMPSVGSRYARTPETRVCFNFAFCGRKGGAGGGGGMGERGGGGSALTRKTKKRGRH